MKFNVDSIIDTIIENDIEKLKNLIECGANINSPTKDGILPIHYAIIIDNYEIVKLLIENDSYVNIETKQDESPLKIAYSNQSRNIQKLLIDHGAEDESLYSFKRFFSLTELHLVLKSAKNDLDGFVNCFWKITLETYRNGLLSVEKKHNYIVFMFFYNYYEYIDYSSYNIVRKSLLKSLETNFPQSRERGMLELMISLYHESWSSVKIFLRAACVEDLLEEKKIEVFELFNDDFFKELEISKKELYLLFIENKSPKWKDLFKDLSNPLVRGFWNVIHYSKSLNDINKYLEVKYENYIWYIKEKYPKNYENIIREFETNFKHLQDLTEFLKSRNVLI